MDPTQPAWFCLRSQQKREHIAAANLRRLVGVEVYNPQLRVRRRLPSGPVLLTEPLFPGYLLARFALESMLEAVRFTAGVKHVVQFGLHWATIADFEIEELQRALESGDQVSEFLPGDEVQVLVGPLAGLSATVHCYMPAAQRVRVLLELLGRSTCVDLPVEMLRASRHYPEELHLNEAVGREVPCGLTASA